MDRNAPAPTAELDDLALTQRCAAGDAWAQHQFFERTRQQAHRTLYRVLGSNQNMEDMLQETYLEAFRSLARFRGESSLATWVDTIAARVVFRYLSRRRLPALPYASTDDDRAYGLDMERAIDARHALRQLYAMLDRVAPKYRIAYTLHVIDGRALHEVAEITGCSVLAVKNRLWRARQLVQVRAARDPVLREFVTALRPAP